MLPVLLTDERDLIWFCKGVPQVLKNIRWSATQAAPKPKPVPAKVSTEWFSDVTPRARKIVGTWLLGCAGMCFGAVVIGGITR